MPVGRFRVSAVRCHRCDLLQSFQVETAWAHGVTAVKHEWVVVEAALRVIACMRGRRVVR